MNLFETTILNEIRNKIIE